MWNGASWSALGSNGMGDGYLPNIGANGDVQGLAVNGSDVYVWGNYENAGRTDQADMNTGDPLADRMTRFNTTSGTWHTVGSGNPGNGAFQASAGSGCNICAGIAIFHSKLHVGGNFSNAGADPLADSIACFALGATPCRESAPVVTPPVVTPPPPALLTPVPTPTSPKCKKGQKLQKGKCVKKKRRKKK